MPGVPAAGARRGSRGTPAELTGQKAAEHWWDTIALNQFKGYTSHELCSQFPHLRSRLPTLWSKSYFAASAGAVSAETVRRHTGTQYERPWRKERSR